MDNKRINDGFNAGCVEKGVRNSTHGNEVLFYCIRRSFCGSSCRGVGRRGKNDHVDVESGDYLLLLHNSCSSIGSRLFYIIFLFPLLRWPCFCLVTTLLWSDGPRLPRHRSSSALRACGVFISLICHYYHE